MQTTNATDTRAIPAPYIFERTQALTVPEILSFILDYATRPTLASAARVSRAWSPIALDKLWSNHDVTVVDLLKILSLNLSDDVTSSWVLQRDPTDDDWARFCSYASRVRSLSVLSHELDGYEARITRWRPGVKNEAVFPRLRRIRWFFSPNIALGISQMRSFVAPGLQELYLGMGEVQSREGERQAVAFLHDLARIEGLCLEKLKLQFSPFLESVKLPVPIANLISANKDTITALELPDSDFNISFPPNHSLQNLNALAIKVRPFKYTDPIQTLVEGCPRVEHLRLWYGDRDRRGAFPDFSCLRKIFAWSLLSFELRGMFSLRKETMGEMAKAWPELKKLRFNWKKVTSYTFLPLSHLADIVAEFPELEDLEASFYYE
ncbi:hypothetical protein FRC01_009359, partial [Tulasnella sp. 417]